MPWCAKRPNISHTVGVVRRFMNNPGKENWKKLLWILMYLRGTTSHALCFGGSDTVLQGYADANMEGDKENKRRIIGYVSNVG